LIIYFLIFLFVIGIILLFTSKKLSPIPYFPTNKTDLPLILKALNLKQNQVVIDLGAGDGIVIFKAAESTYAQKLNTRFIAVEINPFLILVLHLRRLLHPNKKNIKIVRDDIFTMTFELLASDFSLLTFYLYVSPWHLEKVIENCLPAGKTGKLNLFAQARIENFSVVSYMYPIKSLKKKETRAQGKNTIFVYS